MRIPTDPLDIDGRPHVRVSKWRTRIKPIHTRYGSLSFEWLEDTPDGLVTHLRCSCGAPVRCLLKVWRLFRYRSCKTCGHRSARLAAGTSPHAPTRLTA